MNATHLSKRLQAVAKLVPNNSNMADIGSDHAYLPAYLLENELINFAIAGEVRKGPLQNAELEIKRTNLSNKMVARLGDGLDVIYNDDNISVITIAGMGGELISDILERGKDKLNKNTVLVLQPNVDENVLRKWLATHNFKIIAEDIVYDMGHYYEMMKACYTDTPVSYNSEQLDFGPILMNNQSETFRNKWQHRLSKTISIIDKLKQAQSHPHKKIKKMEQQKNEMEMILNGYGK